MVVEITETEVRFIKKLLKRELNQFNISKEKMVKIFDLHKKLNNK